MDRLGDDMFYEMDDILPHSRPQTSLAPSSLGMTSDTWSPVALPQYLPALDGRLADSINSPWTKPDAIFPLEMSMLYPAIYAIGSNMPIDYTSVDNFSAQQNDLYPPSQNGPPLPNQYPHEQQTAQGLTRKRAPKARTISAKDWKPHKDRIRQLYVSEGRSIEELREILNEELGISATVRQYKVQIQHMKLERNVKANERQAVLKHISYRAHILGKRSSHVRIRDHKIPQEKLSRWAKDDRVDRSSICATPPSPILSCISIYTGSICETLKHASTRVLKRQGLAKSPPAASDLTSPLIQRLLRYSQTPQHVIESQETRAVFTDVLHILSDDYNTEQRWSENCFNPAMMEAVIQVRELMNLTEALVVSDELNGILVPVSDGQDRNADMLQITNSCATWTTPYGNVQASFWAAFDESDLNTRGDRLKQPKKTIAARLAIVPPSIETAPFRVVFDFTPYLDPSASINYQAIISNDSEVFKIAASGEVAKLVEIFERGSASLTDRDEQGRSLLNYASQYSNVGMCQFLVDKKVDVNAIEIGLYDFIGPVHSIRALGDIMSNDTERRRAARCTRMMLAAGADFSLESRLGSAVGMTAFVTALNCSSLEAFKHILDLGEPFIGLDGNDDFSWGGFSALTLLTFYCGDDSSIAIDLVDKAILLLNRKANISCHDGIGNTVLHTVLRFHRSNKRMLTIQARSLVLRNAWDSYFAELNDFLMVFITAGADVYATNHEGKTPSMVALECGRGDEWIHALELCGYDSEGVLASCIRPPSHEYQTSKLSFQDYCQQRQQYRSSSPFAAVESGYNDHGSAYSDINTEGTDDDQSHQTLELDDMIDIEGKNLDFDDWLIHEGDKHTNNVKALVDDQTTGLDDIEATNVNLDDWLNNGPAFMQSFFNYGTWTWCSA